jgi:hypothetical protein
MDVRCFLLRRPIYAASVFVLAGCQGHLPALETAPGGSGPKTADIINHISCELATLANYKTSDAPSELNSRIRSRIADYPQLSGWLHEIKDYHFVATAQISLEVTDTEGFAPSLGILNKSNSLTVGLAAQLTGTQDRSVTFNYAIDLHNLSVEDRNSYCAPKPIGASAAALNTAGLSGAIAGDLGLADIVADGLIALHTSEKENIYGSSGPVPPVIARSLIGATGSIQLPAIHSATGVKPAVDDPAKPVHIENLNATMQFNPQAPGTATQGTVTLAGSAELSLDGKKSVYLLSLSGAILPQTPASLAPVYFSLTGNLPPVPGDGSNLAADTTKYWGYSPTINLTGSIDDNYALGSLKLAGIVSGASNTTYEKALIPLEITPAVKGELGGGAGGAAVKGGPASAGSAGGTSFGSLVDFTLVYGANGGPNWTFKRFKGPATGSTPLLSTTRTKTDSLAITFVATCQSFKSFASVPKVFGKYWDSIGACDETSTAAQQQGASVGYENNSLMILRNFLVKP